MAGGGNASEATKTAATDFHSKHPFLVYFYLGSLILAYFAKYFCTSFLYVVQALWRKDQHIAHADLAHQFILGYIMSMIGKRAAGNWADKFGGKKVQMLSLCVYIPVVLVWSFGDRICDALGIQDHWYFFLAIWLCNGFFALGLSWVAIMVCASNWMPPAMEGRLLAVVGCAPELGDATARAYLGPIIKHGWYGFTMFGLGAAGSWQTVSFSAAAAAICLSLPMFICVPESPLGYDEEKKKEKKAGGGSLDATLMTLTCTMCGLLYAIRTMFLLYSVTWLSEVYCSHYHPDVDFIACSHDPVTVGNVATASLLFTFFGMFSVLLSGWTKDNIPKVQRGWILVVNSVILLLTLILMLAIDTALPFPIAVFLVGMIGFGDFGPYKTMSGAFAVDIGGKNRKGDVSAWMGVASNGSAAIILIVSGMFPDWAVMFKILVFLAVLCIVVSFMIIQYDKKKFGSVEVQDKKPAEKPLLEGAEKA
jgi:sugar phosphate permease